MRGIRRIDRKVVGMWLKISKLILLARKHQRRSKHKRPHAIEFLFDFTRHSFIQDDAGVHLSNKEMKTSVEI